MSIRQALEAKEMKVEWISAPDEFGKVWCRLASPREQYDKSTSPGFYLDSMPAAPTPADFEAFEYRYKRNQGLNEQAQDLG